MSEKNWERGGTDHDSAQAVRARGCCGGGSVVIEPIILFVLLL